MLIFCNNMTILSQPCEIWSMTFCVVCNWCKYHICYQKNSFASQFHFNSIGYRIYSNKRRGAYSNFRATSAALIRGRRLSKHCTKQIYFFYIFIQRSTLHLLIFLWTDTKLIVNLELGEKFTRWKKKPESFMITRAVYPCHVSSSRLIKRWLQLRDAVRIESAGPETALISTALVPCIRVLANPVGQFDKW